MIRSDDLIMLIMKDIYFEIKVRFRRRIKIALTACSFTSSDFDILWDSERERERELASHSF